MTDQVSPAVDTGPKDRVWVPVVLHVPGIGEVHAVVDETHGAAVVATIGARNDDPEIDALLAYHTQLIAGIPEASAFLHRTLQVLEDLVRAHPESPSNRSKAGKAARELLTSVRVMHATSKTPSPRSPS